ncbi:hypothetical protein PD280_07330 [Virgibacillus salarius]|uniref:hypothetical protein n=1 Tax=Virgibacillus salarius TaxID=447199 RepID=UPI002493AC93|nr:hypothetical protein [Virgibacillus salarius]WBX81503.1 hypothetical protein PD280_07330 [Virgibacillus salarius]
MTNEIERFDINNTDNEKDFLLWSESLRSIKSSNLHALIVKYDQIISKRENNEKYTYIEELPFSLKLEEKRKVNYEDNREINQTILDIHVSPSKRKAAYVFINKLFIGFEMLNGQIYTGNEGKYYTELRLPHSNWKMIFIEKKIRNNFEGNKQVMQPIHRKSYSGIFQLKLVNLETQDTLIYTEETDSLSDQIVRIFSDLRLQYLPIREKEIEEIRKRELEQERERIETETKRLAEKTEKLKIQTEERRSNLKKEVFSHMEHLEEIKKVEDYLDSLQLIKFDKGNSQNIIDEYITKVRLSYPFDNFIKIIENWNEKWDENI